MYLTEEDKENERDMGASEARRSVALGQTRGLHAHQLKCKGSSDPWIVTANIEELGYGGSRVILKADQEGAIADVQKFVVAFELGETVPWNIPVGESQSNGKIKTAIHRVQGLIRTLQDALEKRLDFFFTENAESNVSHVNQISQNGQT